MAARRLREEAVHALRCQRTTCLKPKPRIGVFERVARSSEQKPAPAEEAFSTAYDAAQVAHRVVGVPWRRLQRLRSTGQKSKLCSWRGGPARRFTQAETSHVGARAQAMLAQQAAKMRLHGGKLSGGHGGVSGVHSRPP